MFLGFFFFCNFNAWRKKLEPKQPGLNGGLSKFYQMSSQANWAVMVILGFRNNGMKNFKNLLPRSQSNMGCLPSDRGRSGYEIEISMHHCPHGNCVRNLSSGDGHSTRATERIPCFSFMCLFHQIYDISYIHSHAYFL